MGCAECDPCCGIVSNMTPGRCGVCGPKRLQPGGLGPVLPSQKGGGSGLYPPRGEGVKHDVTGTQRLRLVLALGVVNLLLATVALGIGFSGSSSQVAVTVPTPIPGGGSPV